MTGSANSIEQVSIWVSFPKWIGTPHCAMVVPSTKPHGSRVRNQSLYGEMGTAISGAIVVGSAAGVPVTGLEHAETSSATTTLAVSSLVL
ncbi:hypothetical protein KZO37_20980 [Rhodococcus fascians]|uniref:hypothetical protein n=1 Tax=Rhodococcoides fascians TaxID=1828 RepID=UPI0012D2C24E|nr:hypothetical protein [Rhodococcus fascians]MBW4781838.1 hypothetical protein [Rhodococcus fascians]MDJ0005293.1 hypothetical protein [Rhodococcus fascians]MSX04667.1 hypothetical protein [Actinomycetota bacterium]